jgi:hypothetical protein
MRAVNVVKVLGICSTPELCIVTEFVPLNLHSYLRTHASINDFLKMAWIRGIAAGMVMIK